jgi:hypothetical protein
MEYSKMLKNDFDHILVISKHSRTNLLSLIEKKSSLWGTSFSQVNPPIERGVSYVSISSWYFQCIKDVLEGNFDIGLFPL